AAGIVLAISARRRLANILTIAGTASVLLAWGVSRGIPWIAPRPALPLTLAAVAVALLAGFAAERVPSLSASTFGAFHGVVAAILARQTEQGGRLLAPLGVRYVVLRSGSQSAVGNEFERQVDMRFAQRFRGAEIVANDAWLSVGAGVSSLRWVAASRAAA